MNVLFLSLLDFNSFDERNIYSDLLREFIKNGHCVCCISPVEKRKNQKTKLLRFGGNKLLKLKIGNTQKVNLIEKGISTLLIEPLFISAIKKYFSDIKFDLVLYTTPPVTFAKVIRFVKKRDNAKSYLMLKDIFPQNSVDLGILKTTGIKGIIYKYFRKKEKNLYAISDYIGCMSQVNVDYVIKHNPDIDPSKIEICPNSIDVVDKSVDEATKVSIRKKYGIPLDKKVFVYGGNLGKPQGIDFMIECLRSQVDNDNVFFLIVGDGTEYGKIEKYINQERPQNIKLMRRLPKDDYDTMVGACDVGMIFLDYRFTIPNFPSRLLSYMQAKIPVFAVTDSNTDIGKTIEDGGFGWWCESNNIDSFDCIMNKLSESVEVGSYEEYSYLKKNYSSSVTYKIIVAHLIIN